MHIQKKYRQLYLKLLDRLPSTYPRPKLVIHSSLKKLKESYWDRNKNDKDYNAPPVAWCDIEDISVHVALTNLRSEDKHNIFFYYLHEIGHLYAFKKYGFNDPRWQDYKICEKYADDFAARWSKKLILEGFLNELC